jgi:hypothetical protein
MLFVKLHQRLYFPTQLRWIFKRDISVTYFLYMTYEIFLHGDPVVRNYSHMWTRNWMKQRLHERSKFVTGVSDTNYSNPIAYDIFMSDGLHTISRATSKYTEVELFCGAVSYSPPMIQAECSSTKTKDVEYFIATATYTMRTLRTTESSYAISERIYIFNLLAQSSHKNLSEKSVRK